MDFATGFVLGVALGEQVIKMFVYILEIGIKFYKGLYENK